MGVAGPRPGARTVRLPRADPVRAGPAPRGRPRRTRRHARGRGVSGPGPVRGVRRHGGPDGLDDVRRVRRLLPAPRPDRHPPRGAAERGRPTRHRRHDRPPARAPAAPVLRRAPGERSMGLRRPVAPPRARATAPARPRTTGPRAKDDATARPRAGGRAAPRRAAARAAARGARAGARIARAGAAARLALAPGRRGPRARRHRRPARGGAARRAAAAPAAPSPDPRRSPAALPNW